MKKLLVVSAVAALGLNAVALAGGLPEEMPMAPAAVSTSDTGVYGGIEGGFGMTNWKNIDNAYVLWSSDGVYKAAVSKDNGFVGRAFLGYDINRYFAIEGGFTYFFNKANIAASGTGASFDVKTLAGDLMGKGKLPVVENFDLYAKLGANVLFSKKSGNSLPASITISNSTNFNLAYGAGADYYITPNIIANVEWLRFNGKEKQDDISKYQPYTDAFMIGLRYKIEI